MQIPKFQSSGVGTTGATGLLVLAGIIFGDLNLWFLIPAIFFIIAGIGQENRANKFYSNIERNLK